MLCSSLKTFATIDIIAGQEGYVIERSLAMNKDVVLLVAEDEDGHFTLIHKNLRRAGLQNRILRFMDGQQVIDFFGDTGNLSRNQYILLLDLRLPKVGGLEVLEFLKSHAEWKKIPTIILTSADACQDVERCHELGCALYIVKPIEYDAFIEAILRIGAFLDVITVPQITLGPCGEQNS
jgi:CheY-like chemotaxis protein